MVPRGIHPSTGPMVEPPRRRPTITKGFAVIAKAEGCCHWRQIRQCDRPQNRNAVAAQPTSLTTGDETYRLAGIYSGMESSQGLSVSMRLPLPSAFMIQFCP